MAVFIVLWPYLLTTKLSCLQKNKFGHTMQGITFALYIKNDRLKHYAGHCIQSWSEIANTADLQHVNFQMGRLASHTNRFCISVSNLPFCKELLYQYMLLSVMKSSVIMATIAIVHESKYPNHEYKVEALVTEQRKSLEYDRSSLTSVFSTNVELENPYCHVVCAFNNISMKADLYNKDTYHHYKKNSVWNSTLEFPFADKQKNFFNKYLKEVCYNLSVFYLDINLFVTSKK